MVTSKVKVGVVATLLVVAASVAYVFFILPEQRITSVLKRWANDPASLVLQDLQQSKRDPEVWCGKLNARNRMGGMHGLRRFVVSAPGVNFFQGRDDEITDLLMRITFEDEPGFDARRSLYCD